MDDGKLDWHSTTAIAGLFSVLNFLVVRREAIQEQYMMDPRPNGLEMTATAARDITQQWLHAFMYGEIMVKKNDGNPIGKLFNPFICIIIISL